MCLRPTIHAQVLEVPIDVQVPLMLKATTYDRTFPSKLQPGGVLQVGICYQHDHRASVAEMESLKVALSRPIAGFKIRVVLIGLVDDEDLSARTEWPSLSVIYITSMRGLDLEALLEQMHRHQVFSVATDAKAVTKGVSMGFELVGGRAKFVINRKSTMDEGCDISSQLLKLARVF